LSHYWLLLQSPSARDLFYDEVVVNKRSRFLNSPGAKEEEMLYANEWVKLPKYCEISGDTADAVHGRRRLGKWSDGDQCKVVDGSLWVNLKNVNKWVDECGTTKAKAVRGQ
jgi:hypothetical protein